MEIKLPLPATPLTTVNGKLDALTGQLNQLMEVKVVEAQSDQNTLALQIGNKVVRVHSDQPLDLKSGQQLTVQLIKLQPLAEFKLVATPVQTVTVQAGSDTQTPEIVLKQLPPAPAPQPTAQLMKQLVVGQLVQFKVVEVDAKQLSGLLTLAPTNKPEARQQNVPVMLPLKQIVNLAATAPARQAESASLVIKSGQWLNFEVVKSGEQPLFKLAPIDPPAISRAANERVITEAIRQYLPVQESAAALFEKLADLEQDADVPQILHRLAREILHNLPQRAQLTEPETLKQQIDNSGRHLEAKLVQTLLNPDIDLKSDLKLKLLQLINQLQQHIAPEGEQRPPTGELNLLREVLQKAHASLAKIVLDQLASLPKEEGNKQTWVLELPFDNRPHPDSIAIQIEQDKSSSPAQTKNRWSVTITLAPPGLGTLQCKLNSYDGVVSTRFWSEQPATVAKLSRHLDYLKEQLEKNGLTPGAMDVQQGRPQQPATPPLDGRNLLNEEA